MKITSAPKGIPAHYKYVFVCGLHRSGTSILGRNIARLENCTGFKNTGVTEDEGQFLQRVYPIAFAYGGPGRFGFDARAHRTEKSPLLTTENVAKLQASWHAHWDKSKAICVEKTPSNILMTRFLQTVFPNSYFIVIRRHPIAVSIANQKMWRVNITPLHRLLEHWLHCHELFEEDKKYLKNVYKLTYEDYVQNSARHHQEIAAFIGTHVPKLPKDGTYRHVVHVANQGSSRVPEEAMEEVSDALNAKYFERWSNLLRNSFFSDYYQYIARKYEPEFNKYGYSLTEGTQKGGGKVFDQGHKISPAVGGSYCLAADAYTLMWRISAQAKEKLVQIFKAVLSKTVIRKLGRSSGKESVGKEATNSHASKPESTPIYAIRR